MKTFMKAVSFSWRPSWRRFLVYYRTRSIFFFFFLLPWDMEAHMTVEKQSWVYFRKTGSKLIWKFLFVIFPLWFFLKSRSSLSFSSSTWLTERKDALGVRDLSEEVEARCAGLGDSGETPGSSGEEEWRPAKSRRFWRASDAILFLESRLMGERAWAGFAEEVGR